MTSDFYQAGVAWGSTSGSRPDLAGSRPGRPDPVSLRVGIRPDPIASRSRSGFDLIGPKSGRHKPIASRPKPIFSAIGLRSDQASSRTVARSEEDLFQAAVCSSSISLRSNRSIPISSHSRSPDGDRKCLRITSSSDDDFGSFESTAASAAAAVGTLGPPANGESSDEMELDNDGMELKRLRGGTSLGKDGGTESRRTFVEIEIGDGDTLAGLALRYNCLMDDLKRQNKLIRDQDLYALRSVRIPVLRHGVVEERLEAENRLRISSLNTAPSAVTMSRDVHSQSDYAATDDETNDDHSPLLPGERRLPHHSTNAKSRSESSLPKDFAARLFHSADRDLADVSASLQGLASTGFSPDIYSSGVPRVSGRGQTGGVTIFGTVVSVRTLVMIAVAVCGVAPILMGLALLAKSYLKWP